MTHTAIVPMDEFVGACVFVGVLDAFSSILALFVPPLLFGGTAFAAVHMLVQLKNEMTTKDSFIFDLR